MYGIAEPFAALHGTQKTISLPQPPAQGNDIGRPATPATTLFFSTPYSDGLLGHKVFIEIGIFPFPFEYTVYT
jgi:hypothetical protein